MLYQHNFLLLIKTVLVLNLICLHSTTFSAKKIKKENPIDHLTIPEEMVYENPTFHKDPLYYYRKYVADMGNGDKKLPNLASHYGDERILRIKHYRYKNQISKINEEKLFRSNDLKHEILKWDNSKISLEEEKKYLQIRISERQTAIKYQIDHDYSWSCFYKKRMSINQKSLHNSLPDAVSSLKKGIKFDTTRKEYYFVSSMEQYMNLKGLKKEDTQKNDLLDKQIDNIEEKVGQLKLNLNNLIRLAVQKIKMIQV